jgi:hypothetical protein
VFRFGTSARRLAYCLLFVLISSSCDLLWKLAELRGQIAELGSAIRQLRQAGMDSAAAKLLITRRRAELEDLIDGKGRKPDSVAPRQVSNDVG